MSPIPENYIEFLHWLKNRTETYWSRELTLLPDGRMEERPEWQYGAKWTGMTDVQINEVQTRYHISFTPEHRAFLRILHTLDRKVKTYDEAGTYVESSFFRNWLEDEEDIRHTLRTLHDYIADDVAGGFWLNSWGLCPGTKEERLQVFETLSFAAGRPVN